MTTQTQKRIEAELLEEIQRRGLSIEYGSRPNKFVRVYGLGVDVKATRLHFISVRDLERAFIEV